MVNFELFRVNIKDKIVGKSFVFAQNYLWMIRRNVGTNTTHFDLFRSTLRTNPAKNKQNKALFTTMFMLYIFYEVGRV
jgi:hypothetical protein